LSGAAVAATGFLQNRFYGIMNRYTQLSYDKKQDIIDKGIKGGLSARRRHRTA
jgi:hypothetical protein